MGHTIAQLLKKWTEDALRAECFHEPVRVMRVVAGVGIAIQDEGYRVVKMQGHEQTDYINDIQHASLLTVGKAFASDRVY